MSIPAILTVFPRGIGFLRGAVTQPARGRWIPAILLLLSLLRLPALEPARPIAQFSQKVWRTEEGLPENFVRTMIQSRDGYLWMGTQEGLARFDGMQITVFDTRNTPQLRSNSIVVVTEGSDGTLWIGTDGGGITRYRDGRFQDHLSSRDGLPHNYIRDIHANEDGSVWVTAHDGGLLRMHDGKQQRWTTADGLASNSLRSILPDRRGRLWIGTNEAGLTVRQNGRFLHYGPEDGLESDQIRAIYEDRGGTIWVGTRATGLYRLMEAKGGGKGRFQPVPIRTGPNMRAIRAILEDRQGALWIGMESGGLARIHGGRVDLLDTTRGLPHNFVRTLLEDGEGNLWVGTRGGLLRLRDRSVETWTTTEGLINDNVKTVLTDRSGALWIGTATGLNVLRGGRMELVSLSGDSSKDFVRALALGRDTVVWAGTDAGLYGRSARGVVRYGQAAGLPDERVRSIAEDRKGRVWVGTVNGLAVLQDGKLLRPHELPGIPPDNGLRDRSIHAIAEDQAGVIWIGTGDGLWRYDGQSLVRLSPADGLPVNAVTSLHVDDRGGLWVGTRGGLAQHRGNRFKAFTRRDGLLSDNIYSVTDDGRGALWLSGSRGVSRLELRQLEQFARGEIRTLQPVSFDTADGMKSAECSNEGHPAGVRGRDGSLWFPTIHGVVAFNPNAVRQQSAAPQVLVEQVRAGRQTFAAHAGRIRIPPGNGDLEFEFTAISFGAPERIRFQYRLEGFDPDWIDADRRREAFYTNLPPGDYRFHVKAYPYNGTWPVESVSQALTLMPHFYQQTWFYAMCLGAIAALGMVAYRLRIRGIERRFDAVLAERTRIAREIHDTLMQGVTGISLQLEASSRQLLASPQQAKERIDSALEKLDATLAEARECILELREPRKRSADLVKALREVFAQTTEGLPLALQFEVKGNERPLPAAKSAELLRIVRETVTNTAVHSDARKLEVSLAFEPDRVLFVARDDGKGFEPERVNGGHFGILGMRERARAMGAELELRSEPGSGTIVSLSIPNPPEVEITLP
jgi:ligand-binding sensor domain-containing protein/signal transduction histidine kinase